MQIKLQTNNSHEYRGKKNFIKKPTKYEIKFNKYQKIMHHDKVRFISEMQDWLNIKKSISVNPPYSLPKEGKTTDHLSQCRRSI